MKIFQSGWVPSLIVIGALVGVYYLVQQNQKKKIANAIANIDAKQPGTA